MKLFSILLVAVAVAAASAADQAASAAGSSVVAAPHGGSAAGSADAAISAGSSTTTAAKDDDSTESSGSTTSGSTATTKPKSVPSPSPSPTSGAAAVAAATVSVTVTAAAATYFLGLLMTHYVPITVKIVSRLSASPNFQWHRVYRAFWKHALMDPLVCSVCNTSVGGGNLDPTEFDTREQLMKSHGPKFIFNFRYMQDDRNQLEILREFMLKDPGTILDIEHEQLLAKLARPARGTTTSERRTEIGLALSSKKLTAASDLRALAKLLDDMAQHELRKQLGPHYEISTLWLPSDKSLLPIEIDILIDMLTSESSTIRHFHVGNALLMLAVADRLQVFQQLLRTAVCSLPDSEPMLKTLHLQRVLLAHEHLASICSALRYPNSLSDLHMEWIIGGVLGAPSTGDTRLMWAWVAFGIFHPDSVAKLDRLNLTGLPLSRGDTMAFLEVIKDPHAGRYIWLLEHTDLPQGAGFEETPLPDDMRVFVKLAGGTKLRVSPKAGARPLESAALDAEEYEVAILLTTWVCVIVPGCSFAWAGANVRAFERARGRFPDNFADIQLLLRIIGHCLDEFSYPSHGIELSCTDLSQTLEACPNLKHLNLKGNELEDVCLVLKDGFQMEQWRILSMDVSSVGHESQILSQLAVVLGDPSSHPLRYIAVSGAVDSVDVWDELARALRNNQTLEHLHFNAAKSEHRDVLARLQSEFENSTLSLRARLAFVSAIHTVGSGDLATSGRSSRNKFDAVIVNRIFAFAGKQMQCTFSW